MTRDIPTSVHQRLLNHARSAGRPFNEVLQYYALNRFLYRLGLSSHKERFILKGALMLAAWDAPAARPTRDIDLLGRSLGLDAVPQAMREICGVTVEEDGLVFDAASLTAEQIMEDAQYRGVRVRFTGYLGNARVPMRIDVGLGDALAPAPQEVRLPSVLDLPPTIVLGYSRESVIAEKLQIMVALGEINSRLKDFYDIWLLAQRYAFSGPLLTLAVRTTFERRRTPIVLPVVALSDAFADADREIQWRAFLRRNSIVEPQALREAIRVIGSFALPVLAAIAQGTPFEGHWEPEGPWSQV